MHITLPYPPSVNHYWRTVNGHTLLSQEGRAYKEHVGWLCAAAGLDPLDGLVAVRLVLYRPRRSGDLDNYLKAPLDAVRGWLYHDDRQVVAIDARRRDDKDNPRVEVWVREVK